MGQQNGEVSSNSAATEKVAMETGAAPMGTGDKVMEEVKQEEVGGAGC